MKIGFYKDYTLPSGYTANCWILGQVVKQFNEATPTDLNSLKDITVDLVLYKDIESFMESKMSTGVKETITISATILEFDQAGMIGKCIDRVKEKSIYFSDASIITIPD